MTTMSDALIDRWLHYQKQRGRADETLRSYRSTMNGWLRNIKHYADDDEMLIEASVEDADVWWRSIEHHADRTRARQLSCVRSFYAWAMRFDLVTTDPTRRLDAPSLHKGAPRYVTRDQLDTLRRELSDDLKRAVLLGAWAGLRVSEAAALNWDDIDTELMRLIVRHGKGDKSRAVGIAPLLLDALLPAVEHANVVTGTEKTYSAAALQRRVNRAIQRVGVDATFHQLRHRYGTITYGATGDILAVAAAMGHSSTDTTSIYAAVTDDALARIAAAAVR